MRAWEGSSGRVSNVKYSSTGHVELINVSFEKLDPSGKNCGYLITICGAFLHQAFPIYLFFIKAMCLNLLVLVS